MRVKEFVSKMNDGLRVLEEKEVPDGFPMPSFSMPLSPDIMFNTKGRRGWKLPAWTKDVAALPKSAAWKAAKDAGAEQLPTVLIMEELAERFDGGGFRETPLPAAPPEVQPRLDDLRCAGDLVDEVYRIWSDMKAKAIANGANSIFWRQAPALWFRSDADGNLTMLRFVGHGGFFKVAEAP